MLLVWPEMEEWAHHKGITRHGYNGGGLDGNNSKRLLQNLDSLKRVAPMSTVSVSACLSSFSNIISGCFSDQLSPNYKDLIETFSVSYLEMQEYCGDFFGLKVTVTWKVHQVTSHLKMFLDRHQTGMSRYAEQTCEAAHAAMKPYKRRFGVNLKNPRHGERSLRTVVAFSSNNI